MHRAAESGVPCERAALPHRSADLALDALDARVLDAVLLLERTRRCLDREARRLPVDAAAGERGGDDDDEACAPKHDASLARVRGAPHARGSGLSTRDP